MKTKIQDKVYTAQLEKRIERLEYLYNKALTSENVSKFSGYISMVGEYLGELKKTAGSINNVNIADVTSYLNLLSTTEVEYKVIRVDKKDLIVDGWNDRSIVNKNFVFKYEVPSGWDGRNSYVWLQLLSNNQKVWERNTSPTGAIPFVYKPYAFGVPLKARNIIFPPLPFTLYNTRNQQEINIYYSAFRELEYGIEDAKMRYDRVWIEGYILLWRAK